MILIGSTILFNLFLIFFFYKISDIFSTFKLNTIKAIIFGYSIFLIFTYYLYFLFKFHLNIILLIWLIVFLILLIFFFKNLFELKKKIFFNKLIIYLVLTISIFYILPAYIYEEQFYVFRGNHWDLFSYLSIGSLFSSYEFSALLEIDEFPQEYKHFNQIEQLIFSRPLTSLLLAMFIKIFDQNIFLISYLFKISLILLSTISFKNLIDNLKIAESSKIISTFAFPFTFWMIYIFEIEAMSHLAGIPIFLVVISEISKIQIFQKFDIKYIFYFGILNCALFLIYPELFCVSLLIYGIFLLEAFLKSKKKDIFFKSISLVLLVFFVITIPSFKTNYMFLFDQINISLNSKIDWWGYFGSFILGKESLIQNSIHIIQIKEFFLNHNLFDTLKYIINLHFEEGYQFFYLNLIPSFFGLYFISIGKISSLFNWLNLFLLIGVIIYLLKISVSNFFVLKKNKGILFNLLSLFILGCFILTKGNIWTLIKLYTFISPFIFLFIIVSFHKKKDVNYSINLFVIFLLILFPIYKYTSLNHGIGKLDSFPSIIKPEMKKDFKWNINIEEIKKCNYIIVDIDDYFKKSYLKLKFLNNSINSNITNFEYKPEDQSIECYLTVENGKFNISL